MSLLSKIDKGILAENPKMLVGITIESRGRNKRYNAITSPIYHALIQVLEVLRSQIDIIILKGSYNIHIITFNRE
jgi:hypothetical protein